MFHRSCPVLFFFFFKEKTKILLCFSLPFPIDRIAWLTAIVFSFSFWFINLTSFFWVFFFSLFVILILLFFYFVVNVHFPARFVVASRENEAGRLQFVQCRREESRCQPLIKLVGQVCYNRSIDLFRSFLLSWEGHSCSKKSLVKKSERTSEKKERKISSKSHLSRFPSLFKWLPMDCFV